MSLQKSIAEKHSADLAYTDVELVCVVLGPLYTALLDSGVSHDAAKAVAEAARREAESEGMDYADRVCGGNRGAAWSVACSRVQRESLRRQAIALGLSID